jgi:hypothetical protein
VLTVALLETGTGEQVSGRSVAVGRNEHTSDCAWPLGVKNPPQQRHLHSEAHRTA